ncbi:MAG: TrmB family transcriptional regulator [Candidatus Bathyarchaeia archaeon]|jgi:sugar-specific transcriptional regulator TrmB
MSIEKKGNLSKTLILKKTGFEETKPISHSLNAKTQFLGQTPSSYSADKLDVGIEEVKTLEGLGLSCRQARVYLALLKIGEAKANAVSNSSLVNRQDIYIVLDSLQQIGLVQKRITYPLTFTATPINQALQMLCQQKILELSTITKKIKDLTKKYNQPIKQTEIQDRTCLGTVFEGDHVKKNQKAIQDVKQSIDAITTWKQFRQITSLYECQLKAALKKGIIIRVITQKTPNQTLPNWIKIAMKNSNFQLKTLSIRPNATLTVFDNTQGVIAFSNTATPKTGPHLWTTNLALVTLTQTYFNTIWKQAETENQ